MPDNQRGAPTSRNGTITLMRLPASVATSADGSLSLKGEIRLAAALQGKTKPEQTLFIYLRPANGGPPIAGMRFTVADLPVQFDFSQAQRMDGGAALPDQVILGARISGTGQARAQAGDLQGTSPPTSPQATGLTVEIDTVVK